MAIDRLLGRGRNMYMAFWDLKVAFDTVLQRTPVESTERNILYTAEESLVPVQEHKGE